MDIPAITWTSAALLAAVGGFFSILTNWIPKFNVWYQGLSQEWKRGFQLGLMALVSGGVLALSCYDWLVIVECSELGIKEVIAVFVMTLVGNQTAYLAFPAPASVRALKKLNKLKSYELAPIDSMVD